MVGPLTEVHPDWIVVGDQPFLRVGTQCNFALGTPLQVVYFEQGGRCEVESITLIERSGHSALDLDREGARMAGSRHTIVGRITELGTHHIIVGGTRIALLDGLLTRELQLGQMVTVAVDAIRGEYFAEHVALNVDQGSLGSDPAGSAEGSPVICQLCGQPIREGDARYREREGDVHVACRSEGPPRDRTPRE